MAVTLNASTSTGYIQTADTSGDLALQSNGTTQFTVSSTGAYGQLKASTAVPSTSGSSVEFTNLPSWVRRITIMLNGVSTNGTNNILVQLGSGSYTTSGYGGSFARVQGSTATTGGAITVGFAIASINASTDGQNGSLVLTNISGNTWTACGAVYSVGYVAVQTSAGAVGLSGTLDRVRIIGSTTGSPTDTFDAGTINILYEG